MLIRHFTSEIDELFNCFTNSNLLLIVELEGVDTLVQTQHLYTSEILVTLQKCIVIVPNLPANMGTEFCTKYWSVSLGWYSTTVPLCLASISGYLLICFMVMVPAKV